MDFLHSLNASIRCWTADPCCRRPEGPTHARPHPTMRRCNMLLRDRSRNFTDFLHDERNKHIYNPMCDACGIGTRLRYHVFSVFSFQFSPVLKCVSQHSCHNPPHTFLSVLAPTTSSTPLGRGSSHSADHIFSLNQTTPRTILLLMEMRRRGEGGRGGPSSHQQALPTFNLHVSSGGSSVRIL